MYNIHLSGPYWPHFKYPIKVQSLHISSDEPCHISTNLKCRNAYVSICAATREQDHVLENVPFGCIRCSTLYLDTEDIFFSKYEYIIRATRNCSCNIVVLKIKRIDPLCRKILALMNNSQYNEFATKCTISMDWDLYL